MPSFMVSVGIVIISAAGALYFSETANSAATVPTENEIFNAGLPLTSTGNVFMGKSLGTFKANVA